MEMIVYSEAWELKQPFRIAGQSWEAVPSILVELVAGSHRGRGEAQGVDYLGETNDSMLAQLASIDGRVREGLDREALQALLPAGGARNALDCALWDLECKQGSASIWQLTGIAPGPVTTVFTIGLEASPEAMAAKAVAARESTLLKIKLGSDAPLERIQAISKARPDTRLVVDANQAWTPAMLQSLAPQFAALGVEVIEQPLPRGQDEFLEGYQSPVMLAADESIQDRFDLEVVAARYGIVNIKLDKTGGLTEALALAQEAKHRGLKLMVGNMIGTSLSMAPSYVVSRLCELVDIDGPLLLKKDRPFGLQYVNGVIEALDPRLWG